MPNYMYKVRDGRGEISAGTVQAATAAEAGQLLRGEGKYVVKLDEIHKVDPETATGSRAPKRRDVITFAQQMAVMIDTGVPMSETLECATDQATNEGFKVVLRDVTRQVQAGGEFSAAMRSHPGVFPPIMTSLVYASKMSGTMGPMLERISQYLTKEFQTAKKIKNALPYPAFMMLMVICVTVFLFVFVMPRFAGIYQAKGSALPGPTQMLMAISDAISGYWYLWLGGVVAGVVGWIIMIRTATGKRLIDYCKLNIPILGSLFRKLYLTRGCRTMGTMISAGVPILDMVAIVRQVTANVFYETMWDEVDDRLRQGSQLSDALFGSPLIPRSVAQVVFSGEKGGHLGEVMERIAEHTETDFDEQVKTTTQFIEPALIGAMGLIIGFVAIALLLPIFSVGKVVAS